MMDDEVERCQLMSDIRLLKQALEDHDDEDEDEDEWCSAKEDMDNEEQFPESTSSSLLDLEKFNLEEVLKSNETRWNLGDSVTSQSAGLNVNDVHLDVVHKQRKPPAQDLRRFDQHMDAVQMSLQLNLEYQVILKQQLDQIDNAIAKIYQCQGETDELSSKLGVSDESKSLHLKCFLKPYFKDSHGVGPPDNADIQGKHVAAWTDQLNEPRPKRWKIEESRELRNDVKSQILEMKTTETMKELNEIHDKISGNMATDDMLGTARNIETQIEQTRSLPDEDLLLSLQGIDWERVAEAVGSRSSGDCKSRWTMVEHPLVNNGSWTNDEDNRLVKLARQYGERNWCVIAEQLETTRTPAACLVRYQSSLNRNFIKR
ncbi:snRNA-activating protein complex subunit 4-like [Corticium candelabrum]|uniref:snRNA-activating protein complex subunit 4-like n=1 Tax=Corticium candelabrum TaxID=121492 RepID=UPI002E25D934|nr:snRNA-activating protein complex subunit 4-like [Corticium candelabrum]